MSHNPQGSQKYRNKLFDDIWRLVERYEVAASKDECIAATLKCLEYATDKLFTPRPSEKERIQ